ncbi:MAG: antibiotic biosynthesis monooxygenase family protein [Chloroflexia bacterium]
MLTARYICKAGMGDAVEAALRRMAPFVAEGEPGCRVYNACRAQDNPDVFLLYEQYVDEAAFLGHRETAHFKEIIEWEIVPLLEKRERELFRLVVG